VLSILAETGLSPYRLEIEITESALVRDLNSAQQALGCLRYAGVRIALDDFGTGYSSLYHLRTFKIDRIKIDRSPGLAARIQCCEFPPPKKDRLLFQATFPFDPRLDSRWIGSGHRSRHVARAVSATALVNYLRRMEA
jgi:hypothetical protein